MDSLRLRAMDRADIPLGMRLKAAAGWNQTEADWAMLLDVGLGFVSEWEEVPCGTVTIVPYGPFAWIGMVLVAPAYRGRGIGTALLEAGIAAIPEGTVARLDATPQGEPLYARRGFRAEYALARLHRSAGSLPAGEGVGCRSIGISDLPGLARFDGPAFGADRTAILAALWRRAPQLAWLATREGLLAGYCFGRSGSAYDQIGPVVAEDATVAQSLLVAALALCAGREVVIDAPDAAPAWLSSLVELGFVRQRPFLRMCLGCDETYGQPERQFAIGGPELG